MHKVVGFLLGCFVISAMPVLAECPVADLTGDCIVNLDDFAVISKWWRAVCDASNGWCDGADINHSGSVYADDLTVIILQWQAGLRLPEDLVLLPAGTFQMGDSVGDTLLEEWRGELPVHTVTLDSFAMGKYEITNSQYCAFLNSAYPSQLKVLSGTVYDSNDIGTSIPYCDTEAVSGWSQIAFWNDIFSVHAWTGRDMGNDPVVFVTWYGAAAYCNWLSQQEGRERCYDPSTWTCDFSKNGYRLPTEAEWEYAARGGLSGKRFPWGDTITQNQANYCSYWTGGTPSYSYDLNPTEGFHPTWNDGIYPYTSPVSSFPANGYGLYNMVGNVAEWCHDWYEYGYSSSSQTNPTGPVSGTYRIRRGGSWDSDPCRVSSRDYYYPDSRYHFFGFRVVLDLN